MTLKAKVANALSFAQMAGLGRGKAAKAEEDDDKKKEDAKKAEDESEEESAKGSKAEADDEDKKKDEDEGDAKKEKSKAESDKEEDEDDEKKESKAKAAVTAHNERCKAIVAHGVKTGQVMHACAYAFDTGMSAEAAIATMDANLSIQPSKAATATLAERMSKVDTPVVKPEGEAPAAGSPQAIAAMVIAAAAKARGEKS